MPIFKSTIATAAALLAGTALSTAYTPAYAGVATGHYTVHNTYSAQPSWGNFPGTTAGTAFSPYRTLTLSGFNSTKGNLTAVHLAFHMNATGNIKVTNTGTTTASVTASDINTFKLASLPGVAGTKTYTVAKSKNAPSVGHTAPNNTATLAITKTSSNSADAKGSLAGYLVSTWTADVGDYGRTALSSGFDGNAHFTGNAGIGITATYSYTYSTGTPVPEPGSFALVGAGLVGLGVMRRRRRS